jgi:ribonuclease E
LDDAVKLSSRTTTEIPAVEGVRPATPAPAPKSVAKTSSNGGGLVGFIKKIFSASAEPEEETKPKREQSNRSGGNRNRSRRGGGGGNSKRDSRSSRGGRGQGERGKSSSSGNKKRSQQKSDSANEKQRSGSAQNRPEQNQGGQNKPEQNDAAQNSSTSTEENAGAGRPRRRRRRRSSGRSRGTENEVANQGNEQTADAQLGTDQSAPRDKEARDRAPSDNGQPPGNSLPVTTAETADGNVKGNDDTGRRARGEDKAPRQAQQTPSEAPAGDSKPADSAPKQPVKSQDDQPAKAVPQPQSSADSGRRLPWETSGGPAETKPSYKVWSSDDKD